MTLVGASLVSCVEVVEQPGSNADGAESPADAMAGDGLDRPEASVEDGGGDAAGGPDADSADGRSDPDAGEVDGEVADLDDPIDVIDTGCDGGCPVAPGPCLQEPGSCVEGRCVFDYEPAGERCEDGDPCTEDDGCDGFGACVGSDVDCQRDHTMGGACVEGGCQGWTCTDGWGDCNDDMDFDGCETPLDTVTDCGLCGEPCVAGAHASADCSEGSCRRHCQSPWENCDGDWANGCEIPTGEPNRCDVDGLNDVDGCWTAYCGSSSDDYAVNFGDWYCFECTTCHVPSAGRCQWCSHVDGRWYPDDACACGDWEDLVCGP